MFAYFMQLNSACPEHRPSKVPPMVVHAFYKQKEDPQVCADMVFRQRFAYILLLQIAEGFTEIIEINERSFSCGETYIIRNALKTVSSRAFRGSSV